MTSDWKKDPRVRNMNPAKIEFLTAMTEKIQKTPKNQLLNQFMQLNTEATKKGISFSDQETELLTEILIGYMNPADRGRLDLLKALSRRLASGRI